MGSGISVTAVTTPALFGGPPETPEQIVRVRIRRTRPAGRRPVAVHGDGITHAPRPGCAWTRRSPPPLGTPPGEYRLAIKAVCQGRIAYGPAIAVHVTDGAAPPAVPPYPTKLPCPPCPTKLPYRRTRRTCRT